MAPSAHPAGAKWQTYPYIFNRHKGCDCTLIVYHAAARQLGEWSEAKRLGVQLVQIDLDRRPDLGIHFGVIRAPTMLLLDATGKTIYKQDEVVTDNEPLDLKTFERKIMEMSTGK